MITLKNDRSQQGFDQIKVIAGTPQRDANQTSLQSTEESSGSVPDSYLPLHAAARSGRVHTCRALLSQGVDPSIKDLENKTAADVARASGHMGLADELRSACGEKPGQISYPEESVFQKLELRELAGLVRDDEATVLKIITDARLDARDAKGDTPLHICAARGNLHLCDLLVRNGAKTSVANIDNALPADRARENGHVKVADLLAALDPIADHSDRRNAAQSSKKPIEKRDFSSLALDENIYEAELEVDFELSESAELFHSEQNTEDWDGDFYRFTSKVIRINDDDDENENDWLDRAEFGPADYTEQNFSTHLNHNVTRVDANRVRSGKSLHAEARRRKRNPENGAVGRTKKHFLGRKVCEEWLDGVIVSGSCLVSDISDLVSLCEGSFDASSMIENLTLELWNLGLVRRDEADLMDNPLFDPSIEQADIVEALMAICSGSNIRPGHINERLTRSRETQLLDAVHDSMAEIIEIIAGHSLLIDVLIGMASNVIEGSTSAHYVTTLNVEPMRMTDDTRQFVDAIDILVAMQAEYDETKVFDPEDFEIVLSALVTLSMTPGFVELICVVLEEIPSHQATAAELRSAVGKHRASKHAVLLAHTPHMRRLAENMATDEQNVEDYFSEAFLGASGMIDRFDRDRGNRFATLMQYFCRQRISRFRLNTQSVIRIPIHRQEQLKRYDSAQDRWLVRYQTTPTHSDLSTDLKMESDIVKELSEAPRISQGLEILNNSMTENHEGAPFDLVLQSQAEIALAEIFESLPDRQADILKRRFGMDGHEEMTLEQCGEIYGITRERIRQIEAKALDWLRHPVRRNQLGMLF